MKKDLIAILVIATATLALSLPLFVPGFYTIHDDQQIARLFVFDQAIKTGQFPVRWVDGLGFGFGYPLFVFYPPLVYILGEIFHTAGFGFIDSVKIVFGASILLSGIAMYVLTREFWGRSAAIVSALFYMFVPYRALDIYVRGALAESFSFVWLPLIIWSFYKLTVTKKPIHIHLSAIFLALLMITHNLIFLSFMLILPLYLLFLILISKKKLFTIYYLLFTIFLALGLSAFFWLPALAEKKFTIVDNLLLVNLANYNIHFVYPAQLWNWPWGFGGSAAGLADGISFKIGKLHILAAVATFILAIAHLVYNKGIKNKLLALRSFSVGGSIVNFALFIFSAFMTTFYSKFIWTLLPPLAYLQFPWRFLLFTAIFSSIAVGALIYFLRVPILKLFVGFFLIILLVIPNLKLFKPQTYRENITDEIATSNEVINWDISSSSFEYLPQGTKLFKSDLGTNIAAIERKDIPKQKIEIISGQSNIENLKSAPHKVTFSVNAKDQTQIKANIFNFPGWQLNIDGNKSTINDNNRLKLITFTVSKGLHQVKIEFKNTPIGTTANSISVFTIIIMIIFTLRAKTRLTGRSRELNI